MKLLKFKFVFRRTAYKGKGRGFPHLSSPYRHFALEKFSVEIKARSKLGYEGVFVFQNLVRSNCRSNLNEWLDESLRLLIKVTVAL